MGHYKLMLAGEPFARGQTSGDVEAVKAMNQASKLGGKTAGSKASTLHYTIEADDRSYPFRGQDEIQVTLNYKPGKVHGPFK